MIQKQIFRFSNAFKGIHHALRTDFNYMTQFVGGIATLSAFVWYFGPLEAYELLFLGLAWTLVLVTELQNSSFEKALDRIHPEMHDHIGHSKDMAAGAVLTAGFFLIFVMVMIVLY